MRVTNNNRGVRLPAHNTCMSEGMVAKVEGTLDVRSLLPRLMALRGDESGSAVWRSDRPTDATARAATYTMDVMPPSSEGMLPVSWLADRLSKLWCSRQSQKEHGSTLTRRPHDAIALKTARARARAGASARARGSSTKYEMGNGRKSKGRLTSAPSEHSGSSACVH
jgi:hypothetical protein